MPRFASVDEVFLNCPFDAAYAPIFRALVFGIYACGFRPRSALELDDGSEARIEKLYRIIHECRYGINDISRTQLDRKSRLPRFNMPLELGIFLGARRYGDSRSVQKRALILDTERFRFQQFISDLAGMDIHDHADEPQRALKVTRDWLTNVSRRVVVGGNRLEKAYAKFSKDYPSIARELGLDVRSVAYVDFERIVVSWLTKSPA